MEQFRNIMVDKLDNLLTDQGEKMLSLDYVKEHIHEIEQDDFFDRRFTKRLLDFLPLEEFEKFGFDYIGTDEHVAKEWTEENILAQLRDDTEFAIEKATNHRGISASLMNEVLKAWCIVLENGLENTEYGWYGDTLIRNIDSKYGFGLVNDNTFDDKFYCEW